MSIIIQGNDLARATNNNQLIPPASYTATIAASEIDVKDMTHAVIEVTVGVVATADATNFFELNVTQSTTTGGTFSAVDAIQLDHVNSWDGKINATTEGSAVYRVNLYFKPTYRFIIVTMTETSTASAIFGVNLISIDKVKPTVAT